MSEIKLTEQDKLIINGKEVNQFDENFDVEYEFGEMIVEYPLHIKVIKNSQLDLLLEKFFKNKDKYKLMVNIVEVE